MRKLPNDINYGWQKCRPRNRRRTEKKSGKNKKRERYVPTLATILVGNDPASATYVKMKGNACEKWV